MQVSTLLEAKGPEVVTAAPGDLVSAVAALLASHRIGAVVVSTDGKSIDGVVSERDIVRALADRGAPALDDPVSVIMTSEVFTCEPGTTVEQLMALMTDQRIRHVPVLVEGSLAGIVSIGDVVKDRMRDLENETQVLHEYIAHGR
ncbi:MAG: CBS domain-containing protein [Acidimicrobiales bacterium]